MTRIPRRGRSRRELFSLTDSVHMATEAHTHAVVICRGRKHLHSHHAAKSASSSFLLSDFRSFSIHCVVPQRKRKDLWLSLVLSSTCSCCFISFQPENFVACRQTQSRDRHSRSPGHAQTSGNLPEHRGRIPVRIGPSLETGPLLSRRLHLSQR